MAIRVLLGLSAPSPQSPALGDDRTVPTSQDTFPHPSSARRLSTIELCPPSSRECAGVESAMSRMELPRRPEAASVHCVTRAGSCSGSTGRHASAARREAPRTDLWLGNKSRRTCSSVLKTGRAASRLPNGPAVLFENARQAVLSYKASTKY